MKEFNLEEAKKGKPVCTRDGSKARIVCFDLKNRNFPIVAAIEDGGFEQIATFTLDGRLSKCSTEESDYDLMMATEKHEGWINIYKTPYFGSEKHRYEGNVIYETREDAEKNKYTATYITTTKIEWEE